MDLLVWVTKLVIPFFGWWLLIQQLQKFARATGEGMAWGQNFNSDFIKSLLMALLHATPENHMQRVQEVNLPTRIRLLWLGLRSLSLGTVFLLLFFVWSWVPQAVVWLLGFVLLVTGQWWKPARGWGLFVLGLALFLMGGEELLKTASRWTEGMDTPAWVYTLATNFLPGALLGFAIGALMRIVFRISGVAWWSGLSLLWSGVLSLGGAWGFFLGDFLGGAAEDWFRHSQKESRLRTKLALGFGLTFLFLTSVYQTLVLSWMQGAYSVQLRVEQLAVMIFGFLFLETVLALAVFHFYHHKGQKN